MRILKQLLRNGAFALTGLQWQNGDPVNNYILDENLLRLPLQAPLADGKILEIHLQYTLQLPNQPGTLGYDARQANFGEWYPFVPAYLPPDGWQVFAPSTAGENLVYDSAGFDVEIRPRNAPPGMLIAANAEADQVGNIFRYHRSVARNFAWSASDQYRVVEDVYSEKRVRGYVFAEHQEAGIAAVLYVSEALGVFGDRFSPYQPDILTFVEASFDDGMEYDGLFFLDHNYFAYPGEGSASGLAALSAHETAHQWWFARVGSIQPTQPWLDEALCVYSEVLYYETLYPEMVDWWWEYRVDSFKPQGFVNSTIYDLPSYRPYVNAVYLRGAYFLRDLRSQLGDETFFTLLRSYDSRYANKVARAEDFFALIDTADLSALLEEYFKP